MCACMHLNIDFLPRSVYIYTQGMLVLGELVLQLQFVNVWPRRMFHSTGRENVNRHAVSSHVCICVYLLEENKCQYTILL